MEPAASEQPYLTDCFKAAVQRCREAMDERDGTLALSLLVTRLNGSFQLFADAAGFIAHVRAAGLPADMALEAVDHPASESGVPDMRVWFVRADSVWVVGLDHGTLAQARAADPPEMGRLRDCLRRLFEAPDLRFEREQRR